MRLRFDRFELDEADARLTRAGEPVPQAIAEARAQEALWLELAALSALCERRDAGAEDFAALAHRVDQLTEGLDTAQVARARALVKEKPRRVKQHRGEGAA